MNKYIAVIVAAALSASAHAEVMAKKGATATLKVNYTFTSSGDYLSPSKDQRRTWNVKRVVDLAVDYVADPAQQFGVLHQNDKDQKQDIEEKQKQAAALTSKMQPTMNDMMKIVQECKENEECISKRVSAYGNQMQKPADIKQTQAAIGELAGTGMPRFQLWRSKSQTGIYSIGEKVEFQVFEMTCTAAKICKRTTTTNGSGSVGEPAGRSTGGASMFEVDGLNSNLVLMLPVPLVPLATETKVVTTIPNDPTIGGKGFAKPMLNNVKPITVTLHGQINSSGTMRIPVEGKFEEGGLLTINWSIAAR